MKSILFVQHGDFAEAYERLAAGGPETYRDQKASVDFVAGLAPAARVTTLSFGTEAALRELAPGLWAQGAKRAAFDAEGIAKLFEATAATHLVLRTPHTGMLREAARRKLLVLPSFADLFSAKTLRNRYRMWKLRRALLACNAPCYSNHSLNASRSMAVALKLPPDKIVPWDWTKVPMAGAAKRGVADPNRPTGFFAGVLSEAKGVGDCLAAVALLKVEGLTFSLSFAGRGDTERWQAEAHRLGISDQVQFLGMIPNAEVRAAMHAADFAIVPSRHSYPEGLPNTIYEGLASRSALVISDHPAFAGRLTPDVECLQFKAGDPAALAAALTRGTSDPALYARLSENAARAHDGLYIGMEWMASVTAFLNDPHNETGWVEQNALSTYA